MGNRINWTNSTICGHLWQPDVPKLRSELVEFGHSRMLTVKGCHGYRCFEKAYKYWVRKFLCGACRAISSIDESSYSRSFLTNCTLPLGGLIDQAVNFIGLGPSLIHWVCSLWSLPTIKKHSCQSLISFSSELMSAEAVQFSWDEMRFCCLRSISSLTFRLWLDWICTYVTTYISV